MGRSVINKRASILLKHLFPCIQMLLQLLGALAFWECMETIRPSDVNDCSRALIPLAQAPPNLKAVSKSLSSQLQSSVVKLRRKEITDPVEKSLDKSAALKPPSVMPCNSAKRIGTVTCEMYSRQPRHSPFVLQQWSTTLSRQPLKSSAVPLNWCRASFFFRQMPKVRSMESPNCCCKFGW